MNSSDGDLYSEVVGLLTQTYMVLYAMGVYSLFVVVVVIHVNQQMNKCLQKSSPFPSSGRISTIRFLYYFSIPFPVVHNLQNPVKTMSFHRKFFLAFGMTASCITEYIKDISSVLIAPKYSDSLIGKNTYNYIFKND